MTYLSPPRLHFAGRFQAAVSTVNNDPTHFDNATFKPEYQQRPQGSWNPRGDADWRLVGCVVTSALRGDGTPAGAEDPVTSCLVADSDRAAPAKLVDLDPQQQLVSQIWGLEVRICDPNGATLLRGTYEPAAFTDLWQRSAQGGEDFPLGAMYQSVLSDLEWGDVSTSPFLSDLREAAADGLLSVKFNVDGYDMDFRSPDFTLGRIVGTIGPAAASEPHHFVAGRQLMAQSANINVCQALVDEQRGRIHVDLGNALPTTQPGGPPADVGTLSLVCHASQELALGEIQYMEQRWYETSAGVVSLPADRALTADELETVRINPLALVLAGPGTGPAPAVSEPPGGLYVRADQSVLRLDPGQAASVRLFATRFGRPYGGATIRATFDPGGLQGGDGAPPVATPADAIDFPATLVTGDDGVAVLTIESKDPANPRGYIDGQVYGIRPALEETLRPGANYPFNQWDFISLLVWDGFRADDPPTWAGSIEPILQQYANLYPVMDRFLDLADYESVCANRDLLLLAFELEPADSNSMPVTRDLSSAKRQAILRWLTSPGPDGKPLLGAAPPRAPSRAAAPEEALTAAAPGDGIQLRGGKAAALSRRIAPRTGAG